MIRGLQRWKIMRKLKPIWSDIDNINSMLRWIVWFFTPTVGGIHTSGGKQSAQTKKKNYFSR